MRKLALIGVLAVPASVAQATLAVDLLTPGDPGFGHPAGMACVDIFVDVVNTDHWTASGLRGTTLNGASLLYARSDDAGTPWPDQALNPGLDHRFTTFVTKPRQRDSNARYTNSGVSISGQYSPLGPGGIASEQEINLTWFGSSKVEPDGIDGYIARIAVSLPTPDEIETLAVGPRDLMPPGALLYFACELVPPEEGPGVVIATYDVPSLIGTDWALWVIPEPGTGLALLLFGCVAVRRRCGA